MSCRIAQCVASSSPTTSRVASLQHQEVSLGAEPQKHRRKCVASFVVITDGAARRSFDTARHARRLRMTPGELLRGSKQFTWRPQEYSLCVETELMPDPMTATQYTLGSRRYWVTRLLCGWPIIRRTSRLCPRNTRRRPDRPDQRRDRSPDNSRPLSERFGGEKLSLPVRHSPCRDSLARTARIRDLATTGLTPAAIAVEIRCRSAG